MKALTPRLVAKWAISAVALTCTGCFGDATLVVSPPPVAAVEQAVCGAPVTPPPRLLTREEYDRTVRDLLGDESKPALAFPPENEVLGFRNNAATHQVHEALLKSYLEAAESIAARVVADGLERVVPCGEKNLRCGREFVSSFAPRAYRRPLATDEHEALQTFFESAYAEAGFSLAVEWTLQVMLQAPQFLYRLERTEGLADEHGRVALTADALASRLSYFLWGSMPDDALRVAANAGALTTAEGIAAEARRMLADPRAREQVRDFHEQWLHLSEIEKLEKNAAVFPALPENLGALWAESLAHYVDDAFWRGGSVAAMLTSPVTFVEELSAPLYEASVEGADFVRIDTHPGERAGLLTQPALMALLASPEHSSPVRRGIFVREKLLCQTLPQPPANLDIQPPDPDPSLTTRERFAEHTARAECAGCHVMMDPVGFGFEHFDALGRFRSSESGRPVDASGELTAVDEEAVAGKFNGAVELSQRLASSTQVSDCIATQWFRFAMGRLETATDVCHLEEIHAGFRASGGRFEDLLLAIVTSDAFRFRAEGAPQ